MGGVAREWTVILGDDITAGSQLDLRLVMTKFGAPAVVIGYSVDLEAP